MAHPPAAQRLRRNLLLAAALLAAMLSGLLTAQRPESVAVSHSLAATVGSWLAGAPWAAALQAASVGLWS